CDLVGGADVVYAANRPAGRILPLLLGVLASTASVASPSWSLMRAPDSADDKTLLRLLEWGLSAVGGATAILVSLRLKIASAAGAGREAKEIATEAKGKAMQAQVT